MSGALPSLSDPPRVESPTLRLLGSPAFVAGTHETPLLPDRPHGLLALLACRREWVRRDELADLLYPGRDLDSARSNLRKVIFLARKRPGAQTLEQRGELLRWLPDTDLARFEAACTQRRHAEALALYGGELLLGLDAAWPAGAREWLAAERLRLQMRWHEACAQRLAELADEPEPLRQLAEQLLREDPLDEVALKALARAQQALGQADQALAAVADFARRLEQDLKLRPSSAVERLARDLRSATPVAAPALSAALVGRRHEQSLLKDRLAGPACRLLTLLGPPGVGKTALARRLASELGGAWTALEAVTDGDAVPAAVANALALVPDGRLPTWEGLARAVGPREALLVLDNCEALPLAGPMATLLAACPGLRVLATSRTPLGVPGEWRHPLEGLPLPDADERDPEVLRANDAVALFEQRVLALLPGFQLAAEAADVVRLVHEVEGLPLALELLAAWRRVMPVADILAELEASLDILEPSAPGERSVRAAFERSWQQLSAAERQALARIAVLPSPCSREIARRVVQAPLPVLAALVDHSLLRADDHGRFTLHPLIRRCAEPRAEDLPGLWERHARHLAQAFGRDAVPAPDELDHLRAAWNWAHAHGELDLLASLLAPLTTGLGQSARWDECAARVQSVLDGLGQHPGTDAARRRQLALLLRCRLAQARFSQGRLDETQALAQGVLAEADEHADSDASAQAMRALGRLHWMRGEYAETVAICTREVAQLRQSGQAPWRLAMPLGLIGVALKNLGRYEEALAHYDEALALNRAHGRLSVEAGSLMRPANLLRNMGRLAEAQSLLQEGLAVVRAAGAVAEEPYFLVNLALVHESLGDFDAAFAWSQQAVPSARQHGEPSILAASLLARARAAASLARAGRPTPARPLADVHDALRVWRRLDSLPVAVQCLCTAGLVLAAGAAPDTPERLDGLAIVGWAMQHPAFVRSEREDAQQRLDRLAPTPAELQHAAARLPAAASVETVLGRLPANKQH